MKKLAIISFFLLLTGMVFAQKQVPQPAEDGKASIKFYPNPASTTITFEFKSPVEKGFNLQFFSFLGRKVSTVQVSGPKVSVNVSEFFKGIYIFQLCDASGRIIESNKFQVSR